MQWFLTFFKSRTPKLGNLLVRTPHKSTQSNTISIFRPKSNGSKKGYHVCRRSIFRPKSSEEQKKVFTSSDVLFSSENIGEELRKKIYPYIIHKEIIF